MNDINKKANYLIRANHCISVGGTKAIYPKQFLRNYSEIECFGEIFKGRITG